MVHFLRLLLITGVTCWGLGLLVPGKFSSAATLPNKLFALTAAPSPAATKSPNSAATKSPSPTATKTPSPAATKTPSPTATSPVTKGGASQSSQTQTLPATKGVPSPAKQPQASEPATVQATESANSQSFARNSEQVVKWLILALIPVGAVGTALYCLRQPSRSKSMNLRASTASPSQLPALPAEGKTAPETHSSQVQRSNAQLANQVTEATVSIQPNSQPNLERSNLEANGAQVSDGSALARTTRIAKVDIVEALITDLHHPEVAQRRKSIWELGQRGDSRAIQPLVDLLVDADSQQRSLILAAIAEISTRTLKPMHRALLMSLQDESADVRKNAIRDITRIYDQMAQVSQLLQYAASDTDSDVQETARWALGQLNRFRTAPEQELKSSKPDELPRSRDPR